MNKYNIIGPGFKIRFFFCSKKKDFYKNLNFHPLEGRQKFTGFLTGWFKKTIYKLSHPINHTEIVINHTP
ncbi:hypothetical protein IW16_15335 [Chryseobacterium vrystaatense]|uniref:Uncharacterized protein n=1 Tax=Chryseobacterium vrystaatense TaxID=307480 RepID=A0ABR4UKL2_9FLAO|nr:hypothetical protein IW16_15335 [Chryseobacterium vrystaatense]